MTGITKVLFWCAFSIITTVSILNAALVQLKNGNQVEGKFLGASKSEIRIEISSQLVNLKVDEISQIIFDKKTSKDISSAEASNDGRKDVIRHLKAIRSLVEGGVDYQSYSSKVNEAKIKIDEFVSENSSAANRNFNNNAVEAIGYYKAAALAWSARITETDEAYINLASNEYCKMCKPLQSIVDERTANFQAKYGEFTGWMLTRSKGITMSSYGLQPLWECGQSSALKAEQEIRK